jgi:hypothetical protein
MDFFLVQFVLLALAMIQDMFALLDAMTDTWLVFGIFTLEHWSAKVLLAMEFHLKFDP